MDIAVYFLLGAALAAAVALLIHMKRKGSSCCGSAAPAAKAIRPARAPGKDARTVEYSVGGMTCGNCARKVQNALNAIPGVSARVGIDTKKAVIRCDPDVTEAQLKDAVCAAGYCVLDFQKP